MKCMFSALLAVAMVAFGNLPMFAAEREEVGAVYMAHLQGMKDKNLGAVIDTLHPLSPAYASAKAGVAQTMINFDLAYKITDFQLVGVSGDFAVVRVVLETRKVGGEARFEDNALDSLQIFRKHDGKWKIWSSAVLEVKPLNAAKGGKPQPQQ